MSFLDAHAGRESKFQSVFEQGRHMPHIHKEDSRGTLIVTGAGRGIGAAVAKLAGARGFCVAVNYSQNAQAAADVGRHIVSSAGRATVIQADISRESEILRLFASP